MADVKPLQWENVRDRVYEARTFYGMYVAFEVQPGYVYLSFIGDPRINVEGKWANDTLDDAKASAQSIHNDLIASTLVEMTE